TSCPRRTSLMTLEPRVVVQWGLPLDRVLAMRMVDASLYEEPPLGDFVALSANDLRETRLLFSMNDTAAIWQGFRRVFLGRRRALFSALSGSIQPAFVKDAQHKLAVKLKWEVLQQASQRA